MDDLKSGASRSNAEVHDLRNQVKELSEDILKSWEKISNYSTKMSTLKSCLKTAIDRADKAEAAWRKPRQFKMTEWKEGCLLLVTIQKGKEPKVLVPVQLLFRRQ